MREAFPSSYMKASEQIHLREKGEMWGFQWGLSKSIKKKLSEETPLANNTLFHQPAHRRSECKHNSYHRHRDSQRNPLSLPADPLLGWGIEMVKKKKKEIRALGGTSSHHQTTIRHQSTLDI